MKTGWFPNRWTRIWKAYYSVSLLSLFFDALFWFNLVKYIMYSIQHQVPGGHESKPALESHHDPLSPTPCWLIGVYNGHWYWGFRSQSNGVGPWHNPPLPIYNIADYAGAEPMKQRVQTEKRIYCVFCCCCCCVYKYTRAHTHRSQYTSLLTL